MEKSICSMCGGVVVSDDPYLHDHMNEECSHSWHSITKEMVLDSQEYFSKVVSEFQELASRYWDASLSEVEEKQGLGLYWILRELEKYTGCKRLSLGHRSYKRLARFGQVLEKKLS